ncbi:MAG: hypothetical protein KF916_05400 [Microbacteriaceae bacterium]|nr:hypothetical protein [Microbacteriaceae bacterium]
MPAWSLQYLFMHQILVSLGALLRKSFSYFIEAIAPSNCAVCGKLPKPVCVGCANGLFEEALFESRQILGINIHYAFAYRGGPRELILALKQHGETEVARLLALVLQPLLTREVGVADTVIVAIPPTATSMRRRGFWPMQLVLRQAGLPVRNLLKWSRKVKAQHNLPRAARRQNRQGALTAKPAVAGRNVVLVDDVVTTGATVIEARRAISEAGGEVVAVVALALAAKINYPHFESIDETLKELR